VSDNSQCYDSTLSFSLVLHKKLQKIATCGPLIPVAIPRMKVGYGNQGMGLKKALKGTC